MKHPSGPAERALAIGLLAAISALYLAALDYSPVFLLNDEIYNALQALSLAQTGRSAAGDPFPVFFRGLEFPPGRDPLCVYATALALTFLPIGETALRLPTALLGLVDIVLMYFVGKHLWRDWRVGLLAAAVLATAPAHFIHSRIGIPTLWALPWLLGWLLALIAYADRGQLRALFVSMLCLGMAGYGYFGTAVIAPCFAVGTVVFLYVDRGERQAKPYLAAAAGLAASLVFALYWTLLHPERWSELVSYYVTGPTVLRAGTPLLSASGLPNFAAVQERVSAYWSYFDPTLLFLRGDASPRYSTGRSGIFLLPALVLLPVGVVSAVRARGIGRLLVFGLLCAPIAGALGNEIQVQRALPIVIFGSLLVTWGAVAWWTDRSTRLRRAAFALCAVALLQFGVFVADYFGHYRLRSGTTRGGNLRSAFATVIDLARQRSAPVVYLDDSVDNIRFYWQFYAVALEAADVAPRVVFARPGDVPVDAPAGALLVTGRQQALSGTGWDLRTRVPEPDDTTLYTVFEKGR